MIQAIWKFPLGPLQDTNEVVMPEGTKLLHVAIQQPDGVVCLWGLVPDIKADDVVRRVACIGTGGPVPEQVAAASHIGTVVGYRHSLVFHFFDMGEA